jgi:3-methyladenine DNA glycosylase AlkD
MKSAMPYAGVTMPVVRRIVSAALADHPVPDAATWHDAVVTLWRPATVREERYAAVEIARAKPYRAYATDPGTMPLYEELIVDGAWWDHVDEVAINLVGPLLPGVTPLMLAWAANPDLWRRRTSIICQVGRGRDLDLDLLTRVIEPNLADREFFIRKAIGWALRHHARVDPDWVRNFVATHPGLSPLSRREAMKHLQP